MGLYNIDVCRDTPTGILSKIAWGLRWLANRCDRNSTLTLHGFDDQMVVTAAEYTGAVLQSKIIDEHVANAVKPKKIWLN